MRNAVLGVTLLALWGCSLDVGSGFDDLTFTGDGSDIEERWIGMWDQGLLEAAVLELQGTYKPEGTCRACGVWTFRTTVSRDKVGARHYLAAQDPTGGVSPVRAPAGRPVPLAREYSYRVSLGETGYVVTPLFKLPDAQADNAFRFRVRNEGGGKKPSLQITYDSADQKSVWELRANGNPEAQSLLPSFGVYERWNAAP